MPVANRLTLSATAIAGHGLGCFLIQCDAFSENWRESPDPEDKFARHAHLLDSSADLRSALRGGAVGIQPNAAQSSDRAARRSTFGARPFQAPDWRRQVSISTSLQSGGKERRLRAEDMNRCVCCGVNALWRTWGTTRICLAPLTCSPCWSGNCPSATRLERCESR